MVSVEPPPDMPDPEPVEAVFDDAAVENLVRTLSATTVNLPLEVRLLALHEQGLLLFQRDASNLCS